VPRYVSLKFDRVNARAGPGDDHRLLWVYSARGLPVQVVAETAEWRRVCDPEGGLAWIHRRTTDGRRMVMNMQSKPVPMHHSEKAATGKPSAFLNPRAIAALVQCEAGRCRIRVDGVTGWALAGDLWGTAPAAQCR
jgi:SH3-like domain-containing protein